jgi:hypothetical protein
LVAVNQRSRSPSAMIRSTVLPVCLTPGEFASAARWMGDVGAAWDRRLAALAARY